MGLLDGLRGRVRNWLIYETDEQTPLKRLRDYFQGDHKKPLKVKEYDDNIILNFVGLGVWRSVSRELRGGVNWQLPDNATAQKDYLDGLWRANRKDTCFLQSALHSTVFGTGYFQIVPDGKLDSLTGNLYPRIIALNPQVMKMEEDPHDVEDIERYIMEYTVTEQDAAGNSYEVIYRVVWRKAQEDDGAIEVKEQDAAEAQPWVTEYWRKSDKLTVGRWELDPNVAPNPEPWPYNFAPIVHWKNLPSIGSCFGLSDIEDAVEDEGVQDKVNFAYSNTGKIVRNQAHKQRYSIGLPPQSKLLGGSDKILNLPTNATLGQLDAQADIAGATGFTQMLRQSEFDILREIDISSIVDKAGALTNFGLRVLNIDAVDKTDTKRQLFGEAIEELNHRLLVMAGFVGMEADPGKVVWGEPLPTNVLEDLQADQTALGMGIVSKEAVYKRYAERYGEDWDTMQQQLADEQSRASQQNDQLGAFLLRGFNRGAGQQPQPQEQMPAERMNALPPA